MYSFFKKAFLIIFLQIIFYETFCQDFSWWNNTHQWDGVTHWSKYMIISPKYMGPNALPIPDVEKGIIYNDIELEAAVETHFSKGDNTQNLFTSLYYPASKNVAMRLYVVPLEHFKMDTVTRDERRAREKDGEGYAGGDIYFGSTVQLLKDYKNLPNISLSLYCKTASGTNLNSARYTDSPGYFFDLSFGKKFKLKSTDGLFYGMVGFYSWQIYLNEHFQDDSFLFGVGSDITIKNYIISSSLAGYIGYINNGDRPLVFRASLRKERKYLDYKLSYQLGLHDFNYQTVRFSLLFHIQKILISKKA